MSTRRRVISPVEYEAQKTRARVAEAAAKKWKEAFEREARRAVAFHSGMVAALEEIEVLKKREASR
jgi:hypothetical protein